MPGRFYTAREIIFWKEDISGIATSACGFLAMDGKKEDGIRRMPLPSK
jgi:hypothetical protein